MKKTLSLFTCILLLFSFCSCMPPYEEQPLKIPDDYVCMNDSWGTSGIYFPIEDMASFTVVEKEGKYYRQGAHTALKCISSSLEGDYLNFLFDLGVYGLEESVNSLYPDSDNVKILLTSSGEEFFFEGRTKYPLSSCDSQGQLLLCYDEKLVTVTHLTAHDLLRYQESILLPKDLFVEGEAREFTLTIAFFDGDTFLGAPFAPATFSVSYEGDTVLYEGSDEKMQQKGYVFYPSYKASVDCIVP